MRGQRRVEGAERGEAERTEEGDADDRGRSTPEVEVVEDRHQRDNQELDRGHEEDVAGQLPEVDGPLVARIKEEPLERVVLPFRLEGAAEPEDAGEDEGKPEEPRRGVAQLVAVRAEGEGEDEEDERREEEHRVARLLGAALDRDVLPEHGPRPPEERRRARNGPCGAGAFARAGPDRRDAGRPAVPAVSHGPVAPVTGGGGVSVDANPRLHGQLARRPPPEPGLVRVAGGPSRGEPAGRCRGASARGRGLRGLLREPGVEPAQPLKVRLVHPAGVGQAVAGEDRDPVGHLVGTGELMGGHHDGRAARRRLADHGLEEGRAALIEPRVRLVDEEQRRLDEPQPRESEPALHAGRERPDPLVAVGPEADPFEEVEQVAALGAQAAHPRREAEVLERRQLLVEVGAVAEEADQRADRLGLPGEVAAGDAPAPRARPDRGCQELEERRLAGAVGAEDREHLARLEREVDLRDSDRAPVAPPEAPGLDHEHCAGLYRPRPRRPSQPSEGSLGARTQAPGGASRLDDREGEARRPDGASARGARTRRCSERRRCAGTGRRPPGPERLEQPIDGDRRCRDRRARPNAPAGYSPSRHSGSASALQEVRRPAAR